MSNILSYISTKIKNGLEFDTFVGNLLAYKPDLYGYTEQDYELIATEFAVDSNSLYYLPAGNYKLINLPLYCVSKINEYLIEIIPTLY